MPLDRLIDFANFNCPDHGAYKVERPELTGKAPFASCIERLSASEVGFGPICPKRWSRAHGISGRPAPLACSKFRPRLGGRHRLEMVCFLVKLTILCLLERARVGIRCAAEYGIHAAAG